MEGRMTNTPVSSEGSINVSQNYYTSIKKLHNELKEAITSLEKHRTILQQAALIDLKEALSNCEPDIDELEEQYLQKVTLFQSKQLCNEVEKGIVGLRQELDELIILKNEFNALLESVRNNVGGSEKQEPPRRKKRKGFAQNTFHKAKIFFHLKSQEQVGASQSVNSTSIKEEKENKEVEAAKEMKTEKAALTADEVLQQLERCQKIISEKEVDIKFLEEKKCLLEEVVASPAPLHQFSTSFAAHLQNLIKVLEVMLMDESLFEHRQIITLCISLKAELETVENNLNAVGEVENEISGRVTQSADGIVLTPRNQLPVNPRSKSPTLPFFRPSKSKGKEVLRDDDSEEEGSKKTYASTRLGPSHSTSSSE